MVSHLLLSGAFISPFTMWMGGISMYNSLLKLNDMREEINVEDDELINAPFEITEKKKLEDVVNELPNVIHKPYGYYEYSEMDKSNERFMRKQENTNSLRETIFIDHNESDGKKIIENEPDLFKNQN